MWNRVRGGSLALGFLLLAAGVPRASAQAPTIEESGILLKGAGMAAPGSMTSLLGAMPGSSGETFGMQPGRDDMILGRIGAGAPRVPTSITTPGGVYQGPQRGRESPRPSRFRFHPPALGHTWICPRKRMKGRPTG